MSIRGATRTHATWLAGVLGIALLIRLILAALAPHPGIADPNHYYNLARNLAEGRGFVIDYIWQYHNAPATVTHPIDYWMPLPAVWPAIGLFIAPDNLFAALIPSVIFGVLGLYLAYAAARVVGQPALVGVTAIALIMFLPQITLNSARTDTTMSYVVFVGMACLAFYAGMRRNPAWLLLAGLSAGLAQLSRQDGIILLPAMVLALLAFWRFGSDDRPLPWRWLWLIALGWLGVMLPWFMRNNALYGVLLPSNASRTMFMTSFIDQFTYGRELDLQHYLDWGIGNIISNIAFMTLANVKTLYNVLGIFLPVTTLFGLALLILRREREILLMLALPAAMVLGLFAFYSVLTPFHTHGGSFFKSYQLIIPFAGFVSAWGLWQAITQRSHLVLIVFFSAGITFLTMADLVRQDFGLAGAFDNSMRGVTAIIEEAGDQNGDGIITIMAQDPYILDYLGYQALMLPSDPLDMILEAVDRYRVDYILAPTARASLEPYENGEATHPRFEISPMIEDYQLFTIQPPLPDS